MKTYIFDFDNTLVYSESSTRVIDANGRTIKKFYDDSYNQYALKDGEQFNFDDFNNPDKLKNVRFTKYWNFLKYLYERNENIFILTARKDKQILIDFFNRFNMYLNIICINSSNDYSSNNIKKRTAIERLKESGYSGFVYYDDCVENIAEVHKLGYVNCKLV